MRNKRESFESDDLDFYLTQLLVFPSSTPPAAGKEFDGSSEFPKLSAPVCPRQFQDHLLEVGRRCWKLKDPDAWAGAESQDAFPIDKHIKHEHLHTETLHHP